MKNVFFYQTEIGQVWFEDNGRAITKLTFDNKKVPEDAKIKETDLIKEAFRQLNEYFSGSRREFDIPLEIEGTPFQKSVWDALKAIPYGETRTYREIAEKIGNPRACRAVGMANNRNPVAIIIPCHRVIGANGKLAGYAGGLDIKEKLLDLEKRYSGKE